MKGVDRDSPEADRQAGVFPTPDVDDVELERLYEQKEGLVEEQKQRGLDANQAEDERVGVVRAAAAAAGGEPILLVPPRARKRWKKNQTITKRSVLGLWSRETYF